VIRGVVVHPLVGVLATAVAAMLAGARSAAGVAEWAGDAVHPTYRVKPVVLWLVWQVYLQSESAVGV
jgi:hypothetical protein